MASEEILVQAASGLESLMVATRATAIKDSTVAQVSAAIYYQSNVVAKMISNKLVQEKFTKMMFEQIQKDFGQYIDAQARVKPKSLHHVYEWKKAGIPTARLFELKLISQEGFSFKLNYHFNMSKSAVPHGSKKRRHVFANKASVMEAGMPLKIAPRYAERLIFEFNGSTTYMPKGASVTVRRPGGSAVKNAFYLQYSRFFSGNLINQSIKKSGFQKAFSATMAKALDIPVEIRKVKYSFSPNSIKTQAEAAVQMAAGMAQL
ncbi:hypothetical protein EB001_15820 [bacterium]|nr:hypothetical protein [bacterium]